MDTKPSVGIESLVIGNLYAGEKKSNLKQGN